jgi:23S rRNA (adenine2503-C2)-methyltransferase
VDIRSLEFHELQQGLAGWGEPAFRAVQLAIWLYTRRAASWDVMTNVPANLRKRLSRHFTLNTLKLVTHQGSEDTTQKFLWRLPGGALIESVLIPANPALFGEASDRVTLCVSTQVGCAYGCKFCASGLGGWKRNLQPFEIVEQVLAVERWHAAQHPASADSGRLVNNLVIMGMGEPLANYDNLLKALRILNASWGGGIGARRITISTCGLVPEIRRLATEPEQFGLAISLHGATNEVRDQLMPVNRKYPLEELLPACEEFVVNKARMVTLEYILIRGLNDGLDQVAPLADLAGRLHAKVNLIPYNHVEGLPWERPDEPAQDAFLEALEEAGVRATLRREKGHDIDAACGQLRLRTEQEAGRIITPPDKPVTPTPASTSTPSIGEADGDGGPEAVNPS